MNKLTAILTILIFLGACSEKKNPNLQKLLQALNETAQEESIAIKIVPGFIEFDSIHYELNLNKLKFEQNEQIVVTLNVTNSSDYDKSIWIDGGTYPVGTELKLLDSNNESVIEFHKVTISSQLYSEEEVEDMKTLLKPQETFSKKYILSNIVAMKKNPLDPGKYYIFYVGSDYLEFEIM